jgi:undecaprenyl-diphosphatase
MTEWVKALLLGIVEGLTEFLPVSSTGHLILMNQWIGFDESFTMKFDVIIQLGAILAVVIFFRKKLFNFQPNEGDWKKSPAIDLWKKTMIGVIPALVLGALLHGFIEELLFNPFTVSVALFVGGFGLVFLENIRSEFPVRRMEDLRYQTCYFIGLLQCLAMVPGTSRSAATIIGAMLLGCSRIVAVEYSFFLAIPTMVAASAYAFLKMGFTFSSEEMIVLAVGFTVSFFVAWIVIAAFMKWIGRQDFRWFGYYRIVLGSIILFWTASGIDFSNVSNYLK